MDNLQPQPTMPPTIWETNPKLKMLLLVLIAVFLFSGIGLTVFAVWSNNYRQQVYEQTQAGLPKHQVGQLENQKTEESPSLADSSKMYGVVTDAANGKVYKNTYFGFQYNFSTSFTLTEEIGYRLFEFVTTLKSTNNKTIWIGVRDIRESDEIFGLDKHLFDGGGDQIGLSPTNFINVAGEKAQYYVYEVGPDCGGDCQGPFVGVVLTKNNKFFEFYFFGDNKLTQQDKLILNSFKFIDVSTNWQTYKNEQYGFELQFPGNYGLVDNEKVISPKGLDKYESLGILDNSISSLPKTISDAEKQDCPANDPHCYLRSITQEELQKWAKAVTNKQLEVIKSALLGGSKAGVEFVDFNNGVAALGIENSVQAAKPFVLEIIIFDKTGNMIRINPLNAGFDTFEQAKQSSEYQVLKKVAQSFKFTK